MLRDDDTLFAALIARDPSYEGFAYVGVTTTGIFCRLTCPARKPKRHNVVFFSCRDAAQDAGFRACLRCKPLDIKRPTSGALETLRDRIKAEPETAMERAGRKGPRLRSLHRPPRLPARIRHHLRAICPLAALGARGEHIAAGRLRDGCPARRRLRIRQRLSRCDQQAHRRCADPHDDAPDPDRPMARHAHRRHARGGGRCGRAPAGIRGAQSASDRDRTPAQARRADLLRAAPDARHPRPSGGAIFSGPLDLVRRAHRSKRHGFRSDSVGCPAPNSSGCRHAAMARSPASSTVPMRHAPWRGRTAPIRSPSSCPAIA